MGPYAAPTTMRSGAEIAGGPYQGDAGQGGYQQASGNQFQAPGAPHYGSDLAPRPGGVPGKGALTLYLVVGVAFVLVCALIAVVAWLWLR